MQKEAITATPQQGPLFILATIMAVRDDLVHDLTWREGHRQRGSMTQPHSEAREREFLTASVLFLSFPVEIKRKIVNHVPRKCECARTYRHTAVIWKYNLSIMHLKDSHQGFSHQQKLERGIGLGFNCPCGGPAFTVCTRPHWSFVTMGRVSLFSELSSTLL